MFSENKTKFLVFIFVPLLAGFFVFQKCRANEDENDLIITEIMYDPQDSDSGQTDWIEIYNPTDKKIVIDRDDFGLIDEEKLELGKDEKHYLNCHKIKENLEISSEGYVVIADSDEEFKDHYPDASKIDLFDSSFSLSSGGDTIHLSADSCETFFIEMPYEKSWGGSNNGMTLEKKKLNDDYDKNDWQESYILGGTPGAKNSEKPEPKDYSGKVKINEIYPAPKTSEGEEEFVEIINLSEKDIDFSDWSIKDEKGNKPKISKKEKNKKFQVFYGSFSLNNDFEGDTVFLYDESNNLVSSQKYQSGKSNYAYAFDGSSWRWTSKITPGEENEFDKILSGKIKLSDKVYAGIYADFEAKADEDAKKFTWNFGDGHKSYLQKTRHKYEKTGKYEVSLKITGNGEDKIYDFTVKVEKYEAPKVKIISFSPNPKGKDTDNEWIEIQNKSKKKVNLINWSVAAGWNNLYNHPIREDFEIKSGKTKKLTKKMCAFTLNNEKTKIELRDPTGKVVQKIKYDRSKNKIEEDEVYENNGNSWKWNVENVANVETPRRSISTAETTETKNEEKNKNPEEDSNQETDFNISPEEIQASLGKYSTDPKWEVNKENRLKLLGLNSKILANQPLVLGVEKIKNNNCLNVGNNNYCSLQIYENYYMFTRPENQKHWAVKMMDDFWIKINSFLNKITNKIL